MAHFYTVTCQKSTAVTCSCKCQFVDDEMNLIVAKGSRLEVHSILTREDGTKYLSLRLEVQLFGRVVSMHAYKPQGSKVDNKNESLFVLTEHNYFCVLGYDSTAKKAAKRAAGDLKSAIGQRVNVSKSALDPGSRMVAMHIYDGHLKILPMPSSGGFADAFDVRLPSITRLLDVGFLHGATRPTLVLLHEDDLGGKHLKTMTVDTRDRELTNGPWTFSGLDPTVHSIIPVAAGGVIVLGQSIVTYYGGNDKTTQAVAIHPSIIVSFSAIEPAAGNGGSGADRFLLGDEKGKLHTLALCRDSGMSIFAGTNIPAYPPHPPAASSSSSASKGTAVSTQITGITMDFVGNAHVSSSLTYLADGLVFLGSYYGDSQFIHLRDTPKMEHTERGLVPNYVDVLEEYTNIGPILDMSVVASEKQGQDVVVTCSGAYGQGSLCVIRSGIGMNVQAEIELPSIKGVWSLVSSVDASHDKYIVQSFLGETRVLSIEGEEVEECELPGLDSNAETLFCGNIVGVAGDVMAIQVTPKEVRLLRGEAFALAHTYSEPASGAINLASLLGNQIVLCYSGGHVAYLELDPADSQFKKVGAKHLLNDIACTSIANVEHTSDKGADQSSTTLVVCGMWTDHTVRVMAVPSFTEVLCLTLGQETQARDVKIVKMDNTSSQLTATNEKQHIMIGLGDGTLLIYELVLSSDGTATASGRRMVTLGKKPITLTQFMHNGRTCVFATGDRPTVVHLHNGKLMFTVVNVAETTGIARFHSELHPGCLVLTSPESLLVGSIDGIQRLHVHKHKVDGDPRRIAYHSASSTYAVCTEKSVRDDYGERTFGQVIFLAEGSFDVVHAYELDSFEQAISCTVCKLDMRDLAQRQREFDKDSENANLKPFMQEFVVVGTAYLTSQECDAGRILIFSLTTKSDEYTPRVELVAQIESHGAVYSLCGLASGVIAAGIDDAVKVFRLQSSVGEAVLGRESAALTASHALTYECGYSSNIIVLFLKASGDIILNGDMMRSVSLLQYGQKENKDGSTKVVYELRELARDMNTNYMRAVEFVGGDYDDHYLGADDSGNLFSVKRRTAVATDEDRGRMKGQAEIHLGDHVNVLRQGSLCSQAIEVGEKEAPGRHTAFNTILYGSVSGAIGSVITIDDSTYTFLLAVQKAVLTCVPSLGGLPHDKWRSFKNDRRTCPQRNFIDGDIVETILDGTYDRVMLEDITQYVNNELNKPSSGASQSANTHTSALCLSANAEEDEVYRYTVEEVLQKTEEMQRMH